MDKFLLVYPDMHRYVAITFAPIQSFIEKSRKLRDLYGSSFILSFLAKAICNSAKTEGLKVILPAHIDVTRGTPNLIYLHGNCNETQLQTISKDFYTAWAALVNNCRSYIEDVCRQQFADIPPQYHWDREWQLWTTHTWELFIVCGEENQTLEEVRSKMADRKQSRNWIGINWRGESSTISGTDTVAYPRMAMFNPKRGMKEADQHIKDFYEALSRDSEKYAPASTSPTKKTPAKAIEDRERLSIPDLIKRLITYDTVRRKLHNQYPDQLPTTQEVEKFTDLQRKESNRWTGWFQGDGDHVGIYIDKVLNNESESAEQQNTALYNFSENMLKWGENLKEEVRETLTDGLQGRIVYAGGDDFFGVLYRDDDKLTPRDCLEQWWYGFNEIWKKHEHDITVSTGFVWAAPKIPQRDLLQHLRQTEKVAKTAGKDRIAIRILFNSSNHLDWNCPWEYLQKLLESYCDRNGGKNWTHIYNDIAILEARHAFNDDSDRSIAEGIFKIYFPEFELNDERLWTPETSKDQYECLKSGLLGSRPNLSSKSSDKETPPPSPEQVEKQRKAENKRFNHWVIDLAKIGFHLFPEHQ
jgi:CRISPR-associated protein Cmr2